MSGVMRHQNRKAVITGLLISGILILVYIIGQFVYTTIDATEERRYTLAPATHDLLRSIDERIYVKILLDGQFPAGFKRLQDATEDMIRRFARVNPDIVYNFENPNAGSAEEVLDRRAQLVKDGLIPTQLRVTDAAGASTQYIYPYAVVNFGTRFIAVPLLQDDVPGADKDVIINNSIALLEYKLADGIQRVMRNIPRIVAFSEGQGELSRQQTSSFAHELGKAFTVQRINLDSIIQIPSDVKTVIVAKPTEAFNDGHLFMLDQYIMRGGNVIFLLDPLTVSLDSISQQKIYIPPPNNVELDPLLFRLGARVNPNLVLDLQCTRIPMVVGMQGDRPQTELFPWYYHPLISMTSDHPVTKGLDRIRLEFPGTVDTIQTATRVKKTVLLTTSPYSRIQLTPVRLSFDILREEPDPSLFNKGPQSVAVMLEGQFESMFKNRLTSEQMEVLERAGLTYTPEGDKGKVMVVADGDIIKNLVNFSTGETTPMGYDKFENMIFTGNRDFLLNAVEYMMDETGVLQARAKDIKLRLLDGVRAREERLKWQWINIGGPIGLIIILGVLYQYFRKRRFAKK